MKIKAIICAIGLFAMAVATSAQTRFGVVGGVNINKIRMEEESLDPKAGFHFGVMMETNLVGNLYFQPSLVFTQKGAKFSAEEVIFGEKVSFEEDYKLNYLQLPVEFSYRMPVGPISLDVIAGPYLAMGLKATVKNEAGESDNLFGEDEGFKRFDAGLRCGIGTHLLNHLGVSLYYDLGFVDMNKESVEDAFKAKNGSFLISASFTF
ncbi:MAG: PorT family protein [Bacteroidales bacterium]|nr:PorT family protein [Bacteroidales bacterium]